MAFGQDGVVRGVSRHREGLADPADPAEPTDSQAAADVLAELTGIRRLL